jgi:phosphonate transport system substrate-binding protein
MKKILAVCSLFLLSFCASAAEKLYFGVNTGVPAFDDQRDLAEKYKPLADYLGAALKRPVRLEVSQSLSTSGRKLKKDAFDVFLGPPQVIAQAQKAAGYVPVARYPGKIKAAFVVMEASGIKRLSDTRGKRLGLPDRESLASYLAFAKLRYSRITPESYFSEILHQRYQDAVLNALKMGRVEVAVVTAGYAKKWVNENPGAQIIEETYEVPHFAVAVAEDMDAADRAHIQHALLDASHNAAGKEMMDRLGVRGDFITTNQDEYAPLIRLFNIQ